MALPWIPPFVAIQEPQKKVHVVDDTLVVTAPSYSIDPLSQAITYSEGVVATYGITSIHADTLTINVKTQHGTANGHVHVTDPDGSLDADNLDFVWTEDKESGHAENILAKVANATISAKSVDILPGRWEFTGVRFSLSRNKPEIFAISGSKIVVTTGQYAKITHPTLSIFGAPILSAPSYTEQLSGQGAGINAPSFSYRHGQGFGVSLDNGFDLGRSYGLGVHFATFPGSKPSYGMEFARSLLPGDDIYPAPIKSDLDDQFSFSYLDNVGVQDPERERKYMLRPKSTVAVSTFTNRFSIRDPNIDYNKPIELAYEQGGPLGDAVFFTQVRLQSLRRQSEGTISRGVIRSSLGLPPKKLMTDVTSMVRFDLEGFTGRNSSGWGRALVGATFHPFPALMLGGGLVFATDWGSPEFPIDALVAKSGYIIRSDLNLGSTKFAYITKFDNTRKWYDHEYYVSQAVGALEPYMVYRKSPSDYRIGLRVRIDPLLEVFQRRRIDPTAPPKRKLIEVDPPKK